MKKYSELDEEGFSLSRLDDEAEEEGDWRPRLRSDLPRPGSSPAFLAKGGPAAVPGWLRGWGDAEAAAAVLCCYLNEIDELDRDRRRWESLNPLLLLRQAGLSAALDRPAPSPLRLALFERENLSGLAAREGTGLDLGLGRLRMLRHLVTLSNDPEAADLAAAFDRGHLFVSRSRLLEWLKVSEASRQCSNSLMLLEALRLWILVNPCDDGGEVSGALLLPWLGRGYGGTALPCYLGGHSWRKGVAALFEAREDPRSFCEFGLRLLFRISREQLSVSTALQGLFLRWHALLRLRSDAVAWRLLKLLREKAILEREEGCRWAGCSQSAFRSGQGQLMAAGILTARSRRGPFTARFSRELFFLLDRVS